MSRQGARQVSTPGTIAPTDYGWYSFLSRRRHWDEVNFWTPSTYFAFAAPEYSPFLFKLKAPHNAVAGFGYFARYAPLPDWLAWDCFGEGNGCASLDQLQARLQAIRRGFRYVGSEPMPQIGCIVVVDAVFFQPDEWVRQPSDWPARSLRATRCDVEEGEGQRVWEECLERVFVWERLRGANSLTIEEGEATYGAPTIITPRLGQGASRVAVTQAFHRACAATREHSLPALEAAHIRPIAREGHHQVRNGLLLRADLHRLFDQGYLTVTDDHAIEVSRRLRVDYQNGRSYYPLHGVRISVPDDPLERPDAGLLTWHNEKVFLAWGDLSFNDPGE